MKFSITIALCAMAYGIPTFFLFGHPLKPLAFLTIWNSRLGAPFWLGFVLLGAFLGFVAASLVSLLGLRDRITVPLFVLLSVSLSTVLVATYVEILRANAIRNFEADEKYRNSFYRSLHEAPREAQFYLHGAALKDCVPYAWSYRQMSFYELPRNVAINVLPPNWLNECQITRDLDN